MAEPDVTYGEIARRLDRQDETLDEIRTDVRRINGSIAEARIQAAAHAVKLQSHDIELRDLKQRPSLPVPVPVPAPERPGIYIPTDGKTLAAVILALIMVAGALATAWMQGAAR